MNRVNPIYHHTRKMLAEEQKCIALAKNDPRHFAPLYEKYHEQIFRYINQRMDDQDLAFDVTSQVFLKAIKNIHKFEFRGVPLGSWLYRIAKSELNQAFRNRRAKRTINIDETHVATFMEVFQQEESRRNRDRLFKALGEMRETDLQLIELRYFEERPYREVGEILSIKENNAKVKTFRALERLKLLFYKNKRE